VREDVNSILRGGREGGGLGDASGIRRSNLAVNFAVNIIFFLCKINLFLLVFKSFLFDNDLKMIIF